MQTRSDLDQLHRVFKLVERDQSSREQMDLAGYLLREFKVESLEEIQSKDPKRIIALYRKWTKTRLPNIQKYSY